ncbi:MAG: phosphoglycerate dehydrogenase [Ignavibacteriae bacterium]|nr:phosphoglycerate dehydrogenase [Ignavibacteriota bacterium]MCB9216283.1 phosphoglycerate dehydrogenase [Ignavibacteria bacterium]
MIYRVLIADSVHEGCDEILASEGFEVTRALGKSDDELAEIIGEFDAMIVRSAVKVKRPLIEKMSRMKVIGRAGAGVDNIDVGAATEHGILVMNTPGGNTISAAEHTLAMILTLLRKIPAANRSLREEKWDRKSFVGTELLEKTVGILGVGRIGTEVAKRLRPFGVKLLGYDPMLAEDAIRSVGLESADLDTIIAQSDILSLHLPLNSETRGMIGAERLAQMKPGSFIINCARGGIVDEADILNALNEGKIAGVAFDVFEGEPPEFPNELIQHPNVVSTPHIAASTDEAQERVAFAIARQIAALLKGGEGVGLVNAEDLDGALQSQFVPYAKAAVSLGKVIRALIGSRDLTINLHLFEENSALMLNGICASMLVGIFEGEESRVNAINAPILAERSNVVVTATGEGRDERYHFLLGAEVKSERSQLDLAVTLFGNAEPRLVMVDNYWFDIRPEGALLLIRHQDRPGTLAAISAVLGEEGVNIADLSLGRKSEGEEAITLVRLDTALSEEGIAKLEAIEQVEHGMAFFL